GAGRTVRRAPPTPESPANGRVDVGHRLGELSRALRPRVRHRSGGGFGRGVLSVAGRGNGASLSRRGTPPSAWPRSGYARGAPNPTGVGSTKGTLDGLPLSRAATSSASEAGFPSPRARGRAGNNP